MNKYKHLLDIMICPICKSGGLYISDEAILCKNNKCIKSKESFLMVKDKPVLIDFENSLVSENKFIENTGKSIIKRNEIKNSKGIKSLFRVKSKITRDNFSNLKSRMLTKSNPTILIVGGGEIGSGLEDFYSNLKEFIYSFDIYNSDYVDFVADAHFIPIQDGYFDLVIVQAVLEHVLDPNKVVSEISRVLKKDGIVYREFFTILYN